MVDLAIDKHGGGGREGGCRRCNDAARWPPVDEEELELLVEEFALPLEQPSAVDEMVEESNRYFKRQYKEAVIAGATNSAVIRTSGVLVPSLFNLSAAVVAAYFTPELREWLPEDVLGGVQRHMAKATQIKCLGEYRRWSKNGGGESSVLVKHCPYDAQGRKHGKATEWRASATVWRTTCFEFGARTGEQVEYYLDGTTKAVEVQYLNERIHGHVKWWYEDGCLAGQQSFAHGLKHGTAHLWREDGTLWRAKHFKDDLKHGLCRTFDVSARVLKCTRYDRGRKIGAGAAQLTTSCPIADAPASTVDSWASPSLIPRPSLFGDASLFA